MAKADKICIYGCGKMVYWDDSIVNKKLKWVESDTGILHSYPRCADLLKEQGKDVNVLKNKPGK